MTRITAAHAKRLTKGASKPAAAPKRAPRPVAPPVPTEHEEQAALIAWCGETAPRIPALALLFCIPNGGHRDPRTAVRLRAEGVRAGIPDLFWPVARGAWHGLFIELKRIKGGRVAPEQAAWHEVLRAQGYMVEVCYGWRDAATTLLVYGGHHIAEYL